MEEKVETLGDFDPHMVHHRDPLTNKVVKVNPYRLIKFKGADYYEWPKGSGNLWWANREPAGRLNANGEPVMGVEHETYVPAIPEEEKLSMHAASLEQENKRLMAELTAIKKEQEADVAIKKDAASKTTSKKVESKKPTETVGVQTTSKK